MTKKLIKGTIRRWHVSLEFKRQDCWIGVFWDTRYCLGPEVYAHLPYKRKGGVLVQVESRDIWICLIPCFPVHLRWTRWLH